MNRGPLISIITVVYNLIEAKREDFFRECLESVHNQSYKNIEHIIVDGASSDGTVDLIKEYEQKGWITYLSEPDKGLYDAMNKGALMAKGDYLAFLNSDDFYCDLTGIEKCIDKLMKTGADFSYAKANVIDENGELMKWHLHANPNFGEVFVEMPFSHQSLIVKSDVFKKLGMYDLKYKSASDYDFVLKMVFAGCNGVEGDFPLVTFRHGGFSLDNTNLSNDEIGDFYQKFYNGFCSLSHEEAKEIYFTKILPLAIIKNVLTNLAFSDKLKFIKLQIFSKRRFKALRHFVIRLRLSKNEKYLILFGKKIF